MNQYLKDAQMSQYQECAPSYGQAAYNPSTPAGNLRPASEIDQHFHRCNDRLAELSARLSSLREVLAPVLAESGPEAPMPATKDMPVTVTCAMSDRLAVLNRQIDALVYEVQAVIARVRA